MALTLNGSANTIAGLAVGGLPDGIVDTDMLAAAAVTAPKRGTGGTLQVVTATYTTEVSTTSSTFSDTGLTCNITPASSSNKVLVLVSQSFRSQRSTETANGGIRILRNSTVIVSQPQLATDAQPYGVSFSATGSGASEITNKGVWSRMYLDSPSSTSAVTYKTQHATYNENNSNQFRTQYSASSTNESSYIILIEVAG